MRRCDLWGFPFDGAATLGWPGARYAPAKVRAALSWMKMRLEEGRIFSTEEDRILDVGADLLRDRGDVDVVPHDLVTSLDLCSAAVSDSVRSGSVPIVVGGDDSQLFATVRGFHDAVEGSVALIHFDAHLDLLDESREQGRYSQSSGMRRCLELERLSPERSMQVAVRNFNFPSSDEVAKESGLGRMTAAEFHSLGTHDAVAKIATRIRGADHVVFSFDIDAVDPAFAPGAGAHEPGGLTSRQALDAVRMLAPRCSGFAVAEVNPMTDVGDVTSTLAAYLVWSFAVYGAPDASPSS